MQQKKSLLPMLLTTMVLLIVGTVIVHHQLGSPWPNQGTVIPGMISRKATEAERQAGIKSIVGQLDAFRNDDYKAAVAFQSSGLKRNFASPAMFRAMMKKQYPQFANYKSAVFGVANADKSGHQLMIPVKLTGHDGVTVQAVYYLILEEKVYRVASVGGGVAQPHGLANPPKGSPGQPDAAPGPPLVTA